MKNIANYLDEYLDEDGIYERAEELAELALKIW